MSGGDVSAERSPARQRGAGATPARDGQRAQVLKAVRRWLVGAFWPRFRHAVVGEERLGLLIWASGKSWPVEESDRQRERRATRAAAQDGHTATIPMCFCDACKVFDDLVRHHVIQLQHGGGDGPLNLVNICESCHAAIHPWLPMPEHVDSAMHIRARAVARALAAGVSTDLTPRLVGKGGVRGSL